MKSLSLRSRQHMALGDMRQALTMTTETSVGGTGRQKGMQRHLPWAQRGALQGLAKRSRRLATRGSGNLQRAPACLRTLSRWVCMPDSACCRWLLMKQSAQAMGCSVPLRIPSHFTRVPGAESMYPGTFIPPHQLSQQTQFMFSLTGTDSTPSQALRRERLKVRNAVLLSTGFLESEAEPAGSPMHDKVWPAPCMIRYGLHGACIACMRSQRHVM